MVKNNRFKSYCLNTLLTIALSAAYCLLGGVLGMVVGLLISALLAAVISREHFLVGLGNSIIVLAILVLFLGIVPGISSGVPLVLLGVSLALATRFKLSIYKLLLLCTALFDFDIIFSMNLLGKLSGGEITLSSMMLDMGQQFRSILAEQNLDPASLDMMEKMISNVVDTSIMLAPAMFTIISLVLSYILIVIYKKIQTKSGVDMAFLQPFHQLQSDRVIAVLFLLLLLVLTAVPEGMFFAACANVVLILCFIFFVLGLSVFEYKLRAKGTSRIYRRIWIIALICCSTMFFMIPVIAMVICGISDAFFDYRHLRPEEMSKD